MKTWQESMAGEMRRLDAATDGILALSKAGAPVEKTLAAREHVCKAIETMNAMLKDDAAAALQEKQKAESGKQIVEEGEKSSHGGAEGTEEKQKAESGKKKTEKASA